MTTKVTLQVLRERLASMSSKLKNMTGKERRTQQRMINELASDINRLQRGD